MSHDNSASGTVRENDIRPEHLMEMAAKLFEEDVSRLMIRKHEFVRVACPACASTASRHIFSKQGQSYEECGVCETAYINPRPTPGQLSDYYQNSKSYAYWNEKIFPQSEQVRRERLFRPRALKVKQFCERYGIVTESILEVGAAFGIFCEEIKDLGIFKRIYAVEPTQGLAETCRKKGFEVIEKPFEQMTELRDLNVIAAFEVLEHLFDPGEFIVRSRKMLADGGLLILTCPNWKGFDIQQLRELSSAVDAEHLNYFHPRSLSALFEKCGFRVLETQTPGHLDAELVRKRALAREIDLDSQPFVRQILLEEWERLGKPFQDFLAANALSSHMWIVGQKVEP